MQKMRRRIFRDSREEQGLSLVELMVALSIILIVLTATAGVIIKAFTIQQSSEANDRGIQVARDYIERGKQASYASLGFYESQEGFREVGAIQRDDSSLREPTVVLPDSILPSSLVPVDEKSVGSTVYQVRVDITYTKPELGALSPKRIYVDVSWVDGTQTTEHAVVSFVRSADASERIPGSIDLGKIKDDSGIPSAPIPNVLKGGAVTFDPSYHMISVAINYPGDSSISDIQYDFYCSGVISGAPSAVLSWNDVNNGLIPDWLAQPETENIYTISTIDATVANDVPCLPRNSAINIYAINGQGRSAPFTLLPSNWVG